MTAPVHPVLDDGGPCDPDRPWAWRNSGDGAEDADDDGPEPPIGPVDTAESYALAMARFPSFVRDVRHRKEVDVETGSQL